MKPNWRSSPCARKWRQKPELGKQKTAAGEQMASLEQHYEEKHSRYVDSLFRSMTEV